MSQSLSAQSWAQSCRIITRRWKLILASLATSFVAAIWLSNSPFEAAWVSAAGPTDLLAVALIATVGICGGIVLAYLVDWLDFSIKDPADVRRKLGLPLLGTVPRGVATAQKSQPRLLEAYRIIRNGIDVSDSTLKSICVLSAAPREGAAAATVSLASVWTEQGMRVLVVDSDLSRTGGASIRDTTRPGLSDYISSETSFDQLVTASGLLGVWMIPAGARGGAIAPHHISALLNWANERYDLVLLYASPLLRSEDAAQVARQADACVMVVRRGRLPARTIRKALGMLASARPALLGVILSGAKRRRWKSAPVEAHNFIDYHAARRHTLAARLQRNRIAA